MPSYDFCCLSCDIEVERYFTFEEDHRVECEKCGNEMIKVFNPTPTHFKGGGWGGS
jgi:putative FmdB family regulatory protein